MDWVNSLFALDLEFEYRNNKHVSIFLPDKTLDLMYKALVRSHLDIIL